jgi:hypothetical protein
MAVTTPWGGKPSMFNQLTPSEIVGAIGVTARDAARSDDPAGEFERDQLLSAYSATRHLAVELSSYGPAWERFTQAMAQRVRSAAHDDPATQAQLTATAEQIEHDSGTASVGAAVSDLLLALRGDDSGPATALRADVHVLLRELADSEVDLLADALG